MLIHIVCWKYLPKVTDSERANHRQRLAALAGLIDVVDELHVGEDVLHLERSFDTGLVAHFKDQAALDVYTDHPEHQTVVAIGRAIAEKVVSVDFVTPE